MVRFLSILLGLLVSTAAWADIGTCVTAGGITVAPWTDGSDPACGEDCQTANTGCSLETEACGQADPTATYQLNAARAHFLVVGSDTIEAVEALPTEAPSCLADSPLCSSGSPELGSGFASIVLVLPSLTIVPRNRGGLLPLEGEWASVRHHTDYIQRPTPPPPRA